MLNKYRDDKRVMAINGSNWLEKWQSKQQSYHFSYFFSGWGWASWRRTWEQYDFKMSKWQNLETQQKIKDYIASDRQFARIKRDFNAAQNLISYDIWDYQFQFMSLMKKGLIVIPAVNLISNVGAGDSATHTKDATNNRINLPTYSMSFPLTDPKQVELDRQFMQQLYSWIWDTSLPSRIRRKLVLLTASLNYFNPALEKNSKPLSLSN